MTRTCKVVLLASLALAGCGEREVTVDSHLYPLETCAAVEQTLREAALDDMQRRLDQIREQYLAGRCYYYGGDDGAFDAMASNGAPSAPAAGRSAGESTGGGGASQVSGTNNQVAGVDEADFVKNDNQHIYVASGSAFRIIEAWPATGTREVGRAALEGEARKLFVLGDRALVYSALAPDGQQPGSYSARTYGGGECTYGYSCDFTGDGRPTKLSVFDISDRSAPRLVRELRTSGSLLAARRIDQAVHTVLSFPGVRFDDLQYYPEDLARCDAGAFPWLVSAAFERLRRDNERKIMQRELRDWLPAVQDVLIDAEGRQTTRSDLLGDCRGFYRASLSDAGQFTTVLSLGLASSAAPRLATIVSPPGAVYASSSALYLAVPRERSRASGWFRGHGELQQASAVHKFLLSASPPAAQYAASGVVKGRVLNQFALDEHEGFLRVATTSGRVPSPDVHSTLTVLRQHDAALLQAGVIDRIAPQEDIRSVRFAGERGYIVTFKKTDPLFVLDLADAGRPRILAELKIPGFSTYMHMMDEQHLLTIGYDADDQGSFAWFTGVLLQIFDVSQPSAPRLAHKELIGTRGSSSEALTNHLAFTYFAPKNLLALPMTVCEGSAGGGSYGTQMTFSGLLVYDVTAGDGFHLRGKVPHLATTARPSCSNWWTNASSVVRRSIVMDDYVFSISDAQLKVNHLDALGRDVTSVPLREPAADADPAPTY